MDTKLCQLEQTQRASSHVASGHLHEVTPELRQTFLRHNGHPVKLASRSKQLAVFRQQFFHALQQRLHAGMLQHITLRSCGRRGRTGR